MTSIYNGDASFEDISFYRKDYTKSRAWKKYLKQHPELRVNVDDFDYGQEQEWKQDDKYMGHPTKKSKKV